MKTKISLTILVIVIIIIALAVGGRFFYQGSPLDLNAYNSLQSETLKQSCSDSDGGLDYTMRGTVKYNGKVSQDRCANSNLLEEGYCKDGQRQKIEYECNCKNGACVDIASKPAPAQTEEITVAEPSPAQTGGIIFANGFEESNLFPTDNSLWTSIVKQTSPGKKQSIWEQSSEVAHSGSFSAKSFADSGSSGTGNTCGKASVIKDELPIGLGDEVEYEFWVYLTKPLPEVNVQLLDLECGPKTCGLQSSPGVRLISDRNGFLTIDWKFLNYFKNNNLPYPTGVVTDRNKLTGTHIIPTNAWTKINVKMNLDNSGEGLTEVFVNDEPDISVESVNIAPEGLEALTSYGMEIGITCNVKTNTDATTLYIDDVMVKKSN